MKVSADFRAAGVMILLQDSRGMLILDDRRVDQIRRHDGELVAQLLEAICTANIGDGVAFCFELRCPEAFFLSVHRNDQSRLMLECIHNAETLEPLRGFSLALRVPHRDLLTKNPGDHTEDGCNVDHEEIGRQR